MRPRGRENPGRRLSQRYGQRDGASLGCKGRGRVDLNPLKKKKRVMRSCRLVGKKCSPRTWTLG